MKYKLKISKKSIFICILVFLCLSAYAFISEIIIVSNLLHENLREESAFYKDTVMITIFVHEIELSPFFSWTNKIVNSYIFVSLHNNNSYRNLKIVSSKNAVPIKKWMGLETKDGSFGSKDAETGEIGESISVGPIHWVHPFRVKVSMSSYLIPGWGGSHSAVMVFGLNGWNKTEIEDDISY